MARPYRGRIVLLGLLITCGTLLPLVPPLLYRSVIDRLIGGLSFIDVVPFAVGAGVLTVLGVTFTHLYTVQASRHQLSPAHGVTSIDLGAMVRYHIRDSSS